jgi:hypothetical protein
MDSTRQLAHSPCSFGLPAISQQCFLSERTSHQQPANSTFHSEQAKRTCWPFVPTGRWCHADVAGPERNVRQDSHFHTGAMAPLCKYWIGVLKLI